MRKQNITAFSTSILEGLEDLRYRLQNNPTEQKIDALLDALQYGQKGIELVAQALGDR